MSKQMLLSLLSSGVLAAACLAGATGTGELSPPPPLEVVSAEPMPELSARFVRTEGWTGGDGAATVPLGKDQTLWLFGDSWVGSIENGRRERSRMINNSVALQSLSEPDAPLRFFWDSSGEEPKALLRPAEDDLWYWPVGGTMAADKLYLFCAVVKKAKGAPGFEFRTVGVDVVKVDNPHDVPTDWRYERARMNEPPAGLRLGVAFLLEGEHVYAYGLEFDRGGGERRDPPLVVGRIALDKLAALDMDGWEFWCETEEGPAWQPRPTDPAPLFHGAGAQMSVSRVPGVEGFIAVYTRNALGRDVMFRRAPRPEGPWGEAVKAYRCPDEGDGLLLYGALAHPELADEPGEVVVTYSRNIGHLAEHVRRPEIYLPQAVRVMVETGGDDRGD